MGGPPPPPPPTPPNAYRDYDGNWRPWPPPEGHWLAADGRWWPPIKRPPPAPARQPQRGPSEEFGKRFAIVSVVFLVLSLALVAIFAPDNDRPQRTSSQPAIDWQAMADDLLDKSCPALTAEGRGINVIADEPCLFIVADLMTDFGIDPPSTTLDLVTSGPYRGEYQGRTIGVAIGPADRGVYIVAIREPE